MATILVLAGQHYLILGQMVDLIVINSTVYGENEWFNGSELMFEMKPVLADRF